MKNENIFAVETLKEHPYTRAKVRKITTPHGEFITPVFMPVGTKASVHSVQPADLKAAGTQILLGGNTYHMLCAPGLETIQALGGMHRFMNWDGPMLTDSGGFQVFSLSKNSTICKITDTGAKFRHPVSGQLISLDPESSIHAQKIIGADIIMAFDQCTPNCADISIITTALERTNRWLIQSKALHDQNPFSAYGLKQALFGIVQGGISQSLRQESTKFTLDQNLDGIAIGGESIGFDMEKTEEILEWVVPLIPKNLAVYSMGVGLHPQDLIRVVAQGVDMFDCVAPTRNARHGALYCGNIISKNHWINFESEHKSGRIDIGKAIYAQDDTALMPGCTCSTCTQYSRGYLHYLLKSKSSLYFSLASIHNIQVMHDICTAMRECILNT